MSEPAPAPATPSAEPATAPAPTTPAPSAEPASAAAAHATEPAPAAAPDGTPAPTPAPETKDGNAEPTSAAAAHAAKDGKDGTKDAQKDADLAALSDDDYAKAAIPDVDGQQDEPDRSLVTSMAKDLREAGIRPDVVAKIAPIYAKAVRDQLAKDEAERAKSMAELTARCEQEISDGEWKDFAVAYNAHIAKDPFLKGIIDHTELGSNPAFIRLAALAGASIRVDGAPPASATAGSGQTDLDRKVFEQTVPKHLR